MHGCATDIPSSRKLAAKLQIDVALQVLAAEGCLAHRMLSDFREVRLQERATWFVQMVPFLGRSRAQPTDGLRSRRPNSGRSNAGNRPMLRMGAAKATGANHATKTVNPRGEAAGRTSLCPRTVCRQA